MIGRLRDEAMLLFASYAALLNHDENIQAEIAWMKKFRPENDKPYAGAYDYALWRYELVKGYWDKLDGTADSIARYAGSVATLAGSVGLGFATVAKIFGSQAGLVLWLLPAISFAAVALFMAILVRSPAILAMRGKSREVLRIVSDARIVEGEQVKGLLAASLHSAMAALCIMVQAKRCRVRLAAVMLAISVLSLSLPLIFAVR